MQQVTSEPAALTTRVRAILGLNGMLGILVGLVGGFAFVFSILGFVELFPFLPRIDTTVPGTERAWRAVHTGSMMNGLLLIGLAAVGQLIRLGPRGQRVLLWAAVITVWGNVVGYYAAAIGGDRGLRFGIDWANTLAYCSFFVAATAVLIAVAMAIMGLLRGLRARQLS